MFCIYREFRLSKLSKVTQLLGGNRIEPESVYFKATMLDLFPCHECLVPSQFPTRG